jgi:hypothetical protein
MESEVYDPEKFAAMTWEEREHAITRKALSLRSGVPPEFNLAPTLELVSKAFYMGFDVIRPDSATPGIK